MATAPPSPFPFPPKRLYLGVRIPRRVIRRYARAIAEEFHPDKIILFGSYAYGTPHADSDVDLLVVMPTRDQHAQAVRILRRLAAPFPLDLIVRTPKEMAWRLEERESFLTTIVCRGKVLYEKDDARVGAQGRRGLRARAPSQAKQGPPSSWTRPGLDYCAWPPPIAGRPEAGEPTAGGENRAEGGTSISGP